MIQAVKIFQNKKETDMDLLIKQKALSILNMFSAFFAIGVNYYSQIYTINGNTVGSLSRQYYNLFTPAGYAFSIWGIIFIGILVFSGYQIYKTIILNKTMDFISQTNYWFMIANFGNSAWIVAWLYEYTFLSVIIMLVILISLIKIIINTNMEKWDAPLTVIVFAWWPISIYAGWISVATIANLAAYFAKINWNGGIFNEIQWTVIMIIAAALLNILIIYKRNMREFAAVGVWALLAIFVRHKSDYGTIASTALVSAMIILLYILYQGFVNRKTNPLYIKISRKT